MSARHLSFVLLAAVAGACSDAPLVPSDSATTVAAASITAPRPMQPENGAQITATSALLVVQNAFSTKAGTTYRFDLATDAAFTAVVLSRDGVAEGSGGKTSINIDGLPVAARSYYWRARAESAGTVGVFGPAFSFATTLPPVGGCSTDCLWSDAQPPGTTGHALLGDGWQSQSVVSFNGVPHTVPTLEELRLFDLLDRGFQPQAAIDWMRANGYATVAAYYPDIRVLGLPFEYIAFVGGRWHLVLRVGA